MRVTNVMICALNDLRLPIPNHDCLIVAFFQLVQLVWLGLTEEVFWNYKTFGI